MSTSTRSELKEELSVALNPTLLVTDPLSVTNRLQVSAIRQISTLDLVLMDSLVVS